MDNHELKLNIGCGRIRLNDHIGIDKVQYIDSKGNKMVDIIRDFESEGLPFCDNSCVEIVADSVLEHIGNLEFLLNECHRVLKVGGKLIGIVPDASEIVAFQDPTHKRFFVLKTFEYFTGIANHNSELPSHPRYARYDFLPWIENELKRDKDIIRFNLSPRK